MLVTITASPRGYKIGRQHPEEQRNLLIFTALRFITAAMLVRYKPAIGLLLLVLPMIMGLFITAWAMYGRHAGLNTDNQFEASLNNANRWYKLLTGNTGYHIAHHYNDGLQLPQAPQNTKKVPKYTEKLLVKSRLR